jgi:hypothetical protein
VNVTTSNVNVAIELISDVGSVLVGSSTPTPLAAGTSVEIRDNTGSGFARCRFTLNSSANDIRGNMTIVHQIGVGVYQTYATSEAR